MPERDAFELGAERVAVERPRRAGVVLSVRLGPEEADQLQELAEQRKLTLSQVVREAIASYVRYGSGTARRRWRARFRRGSPLARARSSS